MSRLTNLQSSDQGLLVGVDGMQTTLSWRWIRDHGEDPTSFDSGTRQRRVYAIGADEPSAATQVDLALVEGEPVVRFDWADSESTWIAEATIVALLAPTDALAITRWSRSEQAGAAKFDTAAVLNDDGALGSWLSDLHRYGFAQLGGFEGGHDQVSALAGRIGYVRATIFGTTWDLSSDVDHHDDTAYSQSFLAPHTDGTYSHEAPGLQMFCCVERTGSGGESVVVDAFAIAEALRTEHPEDFHVLATVNVPAHYIEPGVELRASRPAIRTDATGEVVQVSMNNYDRSPMLLPPSEMSDFYRAYGRLHDLANDRDRWHTVRLESGDVLINDNWRVLHGRLAYTGARHFIGCYLNHEDLESRLRTLKMA